MVCLTRLLLLKLPVAHFAEGDCVAVDLLADHIEPFLKSWTPASGLEPSPFVGLTGEVMFWDAEDGSGYINLPAPVRGSPVKANDVEPVAAKMKRYRFCALSLTRVIAAESSTQVEQTDEEVG